MHKLMFYKLQIYICKTMKKILVQFKHFKNSIQYFSFNDSKLVVLIYYFTFNVKLTFK